MPVMNDDQLFIIAPGVEFVDPGDVPARVRKNFEHHQGDVILTHLNTRKGSKIVGREAAALLKEFTFPKSLAQAIVSFSASYKKNPQQIAEDTFELLKEMQHQELLIPFDENEKKVIEFFENEERFRDYRVKEKCQAYEDTEVYRIENNYRKNYAIKLLKPGNKNNASVFLQNEVTILQQLDGEVNCKLISHDLHAGNPYLITEWCDGERCDIEFAKYRNYDIRDNMLKALDLCIEILRSYILLHNQKILHADINPGNIVISRGGKVKIIDYGFSVVMGSGINVSRGGVASYYEPEFASALLEGNAPPLPGLAGEQYGIAALLYFLLTGNDYIDFSLEKEKMLRQIITQKPVSVKKYDLNLPEVLDTVFSVALTKDPAGRFDSLAGLLAEFLKIKSDIFLSHNFLVPGKEQVEEKFISFLQQKYGWDSDLLKEGLLRAPTCSVNYGSAGIAYMFYRLAYLRGDGQILDLADIWANRAINYHNDYERSFYDTAIQITADVVGKRSIYHSPTGAYLVQALISRSRGDLPSLKQSLDHFLIAATTPCDKIDVTLGKCSLLIGSSIIFNELKSVRDIDLTQMKKIADNIMIEVWHQIDQYPAVGRSNPIGYLGIAHGWAGILYASLLWCIASGATLPANFTNRVEELFACRIQRRSLIAWQLATGYKAEWTGWCNGSAGHVFLWSLLYKYTGEEKYIDTARQLVKHILQDKKNQNLSLCCGLSGQGYALLNLYNRTGEKEFIVEANKIARRITGTLDLPQERNNSLYKSMPGAGILLCELKRPELARMPLFE